MSDKQTLVLVISRLDLDPNLIPPLKLIIPMLDNLNPIRVFTSLDGEIKAQKSSTIYNQLVKRLQGSTGFSNLNQILSQIIKQYDQQKSTKYRICLLGTERVDWKVVMQFRRRNIIIDTVCPANQKNNFLVQISYITEGLHRQVKQNTMIKIFQAELGMSSMTRNLFKVQKRQTVEFSLKCSSSNCLADITGTFLVCSVCLGVYCIKHQNIKQCEQCGYLFD